MPIVAIVVAGLGVGAARRRRHHETAAGGYAGVYAYGADPGKLAERARAQHHEILLQVPMEPFDYPDTDPGPQTLLTTLTPETAEH